MERRFLKSGISRFSLVAALAAAVISGRPAAAQEPAEEPPLVPPALKAASAILVDAATGTVLWEKASRVRRPIASTTKIMTATLLLESGRLEDTVGFSEKARLTEYGNLNVKPGEKFRMMDLLYAIMLRSSNDSCVAVAEHLAGSAPAFARQMTERARQIGATDTNFVTTNGLYHKDHYSTAYDLALITRNAFQMPLFNEVVATKEYTLQRTINTKDLLVRNHNKFLSKYAGADGVKTGYVRQSGRCLVASATHSEAGNPWRLIAVVLNSADTYGDSTTLMEWGKKNFQPVFYARAGEQVALASVRGGDQPDVPLVAANDLMTIVRRVPGKNTEREVRAWAIKAPVRKDQVGGRLTAYIDGQAVGQVDLVAAGPVGQIWTASLAPWTGWLMVGLALYLWPRYGRAFTKSARRRRRRLETRRRTLDLEWEGDG